MMERTLIEYIVNAVWQVPLLAGGAWLLVRVVNPGPQMQHRLWLAVLGLAVLLPVHGMDRTGGSTGQLTPSAGLEDGRGAFPMNHRTPKHRFAVSAHFSPRMHSVRLAATWAQWLVRFYVGTVAFGLFRIMRGWRAAAHLVANSRETSLCRHRAALANYSQRFGIKQPQVRESEEVSSPMIVGVGAPVLLLPEGFDQFTEEEVSAALCHELAHITRRDYLVNVICQVAALPLVWHPVVHAVQQRIRMTREMVCDAMAAREMKSEIGYAKCLLALASSMLGERSITVHPQFLGMFSNNTLEERMMRLMETTTMGVRAKAARVASGAAVMIASCAIAAMFHVMPTMASTSADAPPQAAQNTPAASPEPSPLTAPAAHIDHARSARAKQAHILAPAEQARTNKEVKRQIEDAQRQASKAKAMLDSPEFKKQMEDALQQASRAKAMLDSPEFKKRMEDAQRQASRAKAMLDSPDFKKQLEDAQQQASRAKAMLDSPEFKKQMEDAQQQVSSAKAMLDSPEFKKQMEDLQQQLRSDEFQRSIRILNQRSADSPNP